MELARKKRGFPKRVFWSPTNTSYIKGRVKLGTFTSEARLNFQQQQKLYFLLLLFIFYFYFLFFLFYFSSPISYFLPFFIFYFLFPLFSFGIQSDDRKQYSVDANAVTRTGSTYYKSALLPNQLVRLVAWR